MTWLVRTAALALLVGSLAACQSLVGIEDTSLGSPDASTGGAAGSGTGGTAGTGAAGGTAGSGGSSGAGGAAGSAGAAGSGGAAGGGGTGACGSYAVTAMPQVLALDAGQSGDLDITLSTGACGATAVTLDGPPTGISATPANIAAGATTGKLTVSVGPAVQAGQYPLTVKAAAGTGSNTAPVLLAVKGAPGTLDNSFDQDGILVPTPGNTSRRGVALAAFENGDAIVGVNTSNGSGWELLKLKADGTVDSSFNPTLPSSGALRDVAVTTDGKIVVAGDISGQFTVLRLHADGSPDQSFDSDGEAKVSNIPFAGANQTAAAVAVDTAGKVVVAGWAQQLGAVARLTASGQPDLSFGNGNYGTVSVADLKFKDVGIQSTGKIILTAPKTNTNPDFYFVRLSATGTVEANKSYDLGVESPQSLAMLLNDDFVTVGGYSGVGAPTMASFSGSTLNANSGYGTNGHVALPSVAAPSWVIFGVTATPDGKTVAVGNGGGSVDWPSFIFRVNANGKVDSSFATNGLLTFPASGQPKTYLSVIANSAGGRLLLTGSREGQGLIVIRVWG